MTAFLIIAGSHIRHHKITCLERILDSVFQKSIEDSTSMINKAMAKLSNLTYDILSHLIKWMG